MENVLEEEREGKWREVPSLLKIEAVQAAARSHLESRGLGARQLEPRQRQRRTRMAGKKPPLPPQSWCSTESVCFGVALEAPQPRQLLEPMSGRGQGVWLPRVFVECVRVLRESVEVAGIFRKSGSLTRQRKLRTTLECGERLSSPNAHDVASVLKQYLRELPSPLLSPSLGPALEWAWSCDEGERVENVMCVLLQLPHHHLQMARELCCLLSLVANHQSLSLMDSHSLAVVMTPNIMPTHHSNTTTLETCLATNTSIVQLMIDHAHLIGLAPAHVINHAHQSVKEGVATESVSSSSESLDEGGTKKDKQRRSSVADRVLGWGTKLMSSLQVGGSRDADHTHSPFGSNEAGGLQIGKTSSQRLFEPSFPPGATPKTPRSGHKRRRSFLSARRHTDGRRGHKSLFSNPFRGPILKGGDFARFGSTRFSERKFPWLQGRAPSTPDPDVQLVGFGVRSSIIGEPQDKDFNDGNFPDNIVIGNSVTTTPVLGNNALLASLSEENVTTAEGEGEVNEGVEPPKTYSVTRHHSGKRMRCEVGEEEGGTRAIKRRHTIYTSGSRESLTDVAGIRSSKSATTLGHINSDPSPSFSFSKPTPQRLAKQRIPRTVAMENDKQNSDAVAPPTSLGVPFTFSNPRLYVAKRRLVSNGDDCVDQSEGGREVCGASPIPHLPELTPHKSPHDNRQSHPVAVTPAPRSQLNEGFVTTPFPPHSAASPNLLQQISSELIERYPQTTPLATPTTREAGLGMNESYRQAVYSRRLVKPVSLEYSVTPDSNLGPEVMQEVSFTFQINSPGCHSNKSPPPTNTAARVPLSPLPHRPPVGRGSGDLRPQKQRRFGLTPRPKFTDLSSPFPAVGGQRMAGKTPRVARRAQMYVIPSSGSHGDKENMCADVATREWIV